MKHMGRGVELISAGVETWIDIYHSQEVYVNAGDRGEGGRENVNTTIIKRRWDIRGSPVLVKAVMRGPIPMGTSNVANVGVSTT